MAQPFQWDTWPQVDEAIAKADLPLVIACMAQAWSPPSMHAARALSEIRASDEIKFARILVVDADHEVPKAFDLRVSSTPAVFFFWHDKPLVWVEMIRLARDTGERKQHVLSVDY
eukprot:m51a1_g8160 hypothetical protein (115) ;mRNA; f:66560-67176